MCYKIDAEFILISKLLNQEFCTISDLFEKKLEIENQISNVFVDVSKTSVINFILCYPEYFKLEGDKILKRKGADDFLCNKLVMSYFNNKVDTSIREKVQSHFENV